MGHKVMTRRRQAWTMAAVAGVAAMSLGACGSSSNGEASKPATQVLADAKQATANAASVHVAGGISQGGDRVQLNLDVGHGNGGGMVSQSGQSFQIVLKGSAVYLKAPAATLSKLAGPSAAQLLAGKWLQTTTANPDFTDLVSLLDVSKLVSALSSHGTLVRGSATTFHGASAVPLTDNGGNKGTLFVAATGKPYILGVTGGGAKKGTIIFDQYGSAQAPPAPANAINLDKLQQSGSP